MLKRKLPLLIILVVLIISACSTLNNSSTTFRPTQTLIDAKNEEVLTNSPSLSSPFFHENFEDSPALENLFSPDGTRWHGIQLQPGSNLITITDEQAHTGSNAIKFVAQPYNGSQASKADIYIGELGLLNGDEIWTEMWVYLSGTPDTTNLFLWDLEATKTCFLFQCQSPGRRLYFSGPNGGWLKSDLGKWYRGEDFLQNEGEEITFPKKIWVRLRVYLYLSPEQNGVMLVWQDNALVIDSVGITFPTADSVHDRLEVGITANGNRTNDITLYIDDISIWDKDPGW